MSNNRDDFSQKVKNLLAKRSAYRCNNPKCKHITIGANSNPLKSTNIGVAAHITAAAPNGPRYNPNMSTDERASISNAIWLCQTCSVLIDKDPDMYPCDLLNKWKKNAEILSMNAINNPESLDSNADLYDEQFLDNELQTDFETQYEKMEQYSKLYCDIISLLAACRRSKSWDNRSELKLYSWLNNHSENEISDLETDELYIIRQNMIEYLQLHIDMDIDISYIPPDNYIDENYLFNYIQIHPALTLNELSDAMRISLSSMESALKLLWDKGNIIPIISPKLSTTDFGQLRWMEKYI